MEYRDFLITLNACGVENNYTEKIEEFLNSSSLNFRELFKSNYLEKIIPKSQIAKIFNYDKNKLENLKNYCTNNGIKIITYLDKEYPERLKFIDNFPRVLYIKGEFKEEDFISVGIVGSRKYSSYGKVVVEYLVDNLKEQNATIISGMAYGIDALSHTRALKNNMRTIAVLGSGIDVIYPKANTNIYNSICESGVVCSEYPPGTPPSQYRFPLRNRIISGLSLAVVVIEARRRSGSLITARLAAEQGREVFAVPGNINSFYSEGTNELIRDGVNIFSSIEDLTSILPVQNEKEEIDIELSDKELEIYNKIKLQPIEIDELARSLKINISELSTYLTILELKEVICVEGKNIIAKL